MLELWLGYKNQHQIIRVRRWRNLTELFTAISFPMFLASCRWLMRLLYDKCLSLKLSSGYLGRGSQSCGWGHSGQILQQMEAAHWTAWAVSPEPAIVWCPWFTFISCSSHSFFGEHDVEDTQCESPSQRHHFVEGQSKLPLMEMSIRFLRLMDRNVQTGPAHQTCKQLCLLYYMIVKVFIWPTKCCRWEHSLSHSWESSVRLPCTFVYNTIYLCAFGSSLKVFCTNSNWEENCPWALWSSGLKMIQHIVYPCTVALWSGQATATSHLFNVLWWAFYTKVNGTNPTKNIGATTIYDSAGQDSSTNHQKIGQEQCCFVRLSAAFLSCHNKIQIYLYEKFWISAFTKQFRHYLDYLPVTLAL